MRIKSYTKAIIIICCVLCLCVVPSFCALPQITVFAETDFNVQAKSGILVDYSSGEVLFEQDADAKLQVASMVKLMTILLTIEEIKEGNIKLEDKLVATEFAASMEGSQVFIDANSKYSIDDMLKSVIMASANDASVALAEHISGSEKSFVKKMNARAKELGMNNTIYVNSTGLPAPMQYSTARDCATILAMLIPDELYHKYSTIWMDTLTHSSGRKTELVNTNKLIRYYKGCDTGKTGSTDEAGFCLSASAERDNMRLIAVVMGTKSSKERFNQTVGLFNYGFSNFTNEKIVDKNDILGLVKAKKAKVGEVKVFAGEDFYAVTKKGGEVDFEITTEIKESVKAPMFAGDTVGRLLISKNGKVIKEIPLIIKEDILTITFGDGFKKIVKEF